MKNITATENYSLVSSPSTPPCAFACPLGQEIQEYVACLAEGKFMKALSIIRETNPFPSICGRFCSRPCEFECRMADTESQIAIRELKRFAGDMELEPGRMEGGRELQKLSRNQQVFIIGAGLSGLSAAYFLRSLGYKVTVLEARAEGGGMMSICAAGEILDKAVLNKEIEFIQSTGVEIITGVMAGRDFSIYELFNRGASAVIIATGATVFKIPPGIMHAKNYNGFLFSLDWLEKKEQLSRTFGGKYVVINGLSLLTLQMAMILAKAGASGVKIIVQYPQKLFPVDVAYIEAARKLGVEILPLSFVEGLRAKRGRLCEVVIKAVEGSEILSGKDKILKKVGNKNQVIRADFYIPANVRVFDSSPFKNESWLNLSEMGLLKVSYDSMMIDDKGIFGAGEAILGARGVVEVIASGKKVAGKVHNFLTGEVAPWEIKSGKMDDRGFNFYDIYEKGELEKINLERQLNEIRKISYGKDKTGKILTPAMAMDEARRCLRCGSCFDCRSCHHYCRWFVMSDVSESIIGLQNKYRMQEGILNEMNLNYNFDSISILDRAVKADRVRIDESLCDGCAICESSCPYGVINTTAVCGQNEPPVAVIDYESCRGCGLCASSCPSEAIYCQGWEEKQIIEYCISNGAADFLVIKCRWSGKPSGKNEVGVNCAGRLSIRLLAKIMELGCRKITIVGCGEKCHYEKGTQILKRRIRVLKEIMDEISYGCFSIDYIDAGDSIPCYSVKADSAFVEAEGAGNFSSDTNVRSENRGEHPLPLLESFANILMKAGKKNIPDANARMVFFPGCMDFAFRLYAQEVSPNNEYRIFNPDIMDATKSAFNLLCSLKGKDNVVTFSGCCGMPLLISGKKDKYDEYLKALDEYFKRAGAEIIVTGCSGCLECLMEVKGKTEFDGYRFMHLIEILGEKMDDGLEGKQKSIFNYPGQNSVMAILQSGENETSKRLARLSETILKRAGLNPQILSLPVYSSSCRAANGREIAKENIKIIKSAVSMGARAILTISNLQLFHLSKFFQYGFWGGFNIDIMPVHVFLIKMWKNKS